MFPISLIIVSFIPLTLEYFDLFPEFVVLLQFKSLQVILKPILHAVRLFKLLVLGAPARLIQCIFVSRIPP